jgi:ribulose-bisphosphate carboxylase large chain
MDLYRHDVDKDKYILATYMVDSRSSVRLAAEAIAIGQSIGNPTERSPWENEDLIREHGCLIINNEDGLARSKVAAVTIAYPIVNLSQADGINQLLAHVMGGHLEIDLITQCKLINLEIPPKVVHWYNGPRYGLNGIRDFTGVTQSRPLLGAIIKPKTGIPPGTILEIVKQLADGGVDFIKEDEILSDPDHCRLRDRVPLISNWLTNHHQGLIYAYSITADPMAPGGHGLLDRVRFVHDEGGNAVHFNWWAGLGAYRAARDLNLDLFLFMQKSGASILTDPRNPYQVHERVLLKLAALAGVDFAHAGMWSGYHHEEVGPLAEKITVLKQHGVMPSLSCGMHPGLVQAMISQFGPDIMLTSGGSIHAHPGGTLSGARAFRQAIDGRAGLEYELAIKKWGLVRVPNGTRA